MRTLTFLFAIIIITLSSCMDDGGDTMLWSRAIEITLVDSETGEYLIGNEATSQYHPDSIVIYNQSGNEVPRVISGGESTGCYKIYVKIDKIFNGRSEIPDFDTTYYFQLSKTDIDTIHVTYEYHSSTDFYYMDFNYNNVPYSYRHSNFTCGYVVSKKVEEAE